MKASASKAVAARCTLAMPLSGGRHLHLDSRLRAGRSFETPAINVSEAVRIPAQAKTTLSYRSHRCRHLSVPHRERASCACCSPASTATATDSEQPQPVRKLTGIAGALAAMIAAIPAFLRQATPKEFQAQRSPVSGAMRTFRMAAVVLPFASMEMGSTTFLMTKAVGSFMKTYLLLLFLRVLLSWFPAFNWERQPWLALRQMTDPYLQLFRGIIPPLLGMIDFTPLLGFFILQWLSGLLQGLTMEDEIEGYW